jgi:1-deoxy-D-xylulose-5-phosphate synthase
VICQPRDGHVLKELLESAFHWNRPTAIRYPNMATEETTTPLLTRELGTAEVLSKGSTLALIALGHMTHTALQVRKLLQEHGIEATVIDPVFIKPLDSDLFCGILDSHPYVVTIEEHSLNGGLGMIFNSFMVKNKFTKTQILNFGIPDTFVEQGSHRELLIELGLTPEAIAEQILFEFSSLKAEEMVSK